MVDQLSSVFRAPHQLIGVVVFFRASTEPSRTDSFSRVSGDLGAIISQLLAIGASNNGHNEVESSLSVLSVGRDCQRVCTGVSGRSTLPLDFGVVEEAPVHRLANSSVNLGGNVVGADDHSSSAKANLGLACR